MRTTKKELAALFGQLCRALGRNESNGKREPGSWYLERDAVCGWQIIEFNQSGFGYQFPFWTFSGSAQEVAMAMRYAIRALEIKQGGQNG
jgi:hypothetical protein